MDTERLAQLLKKAYNDFRNTEGSRKREVMYARLEGICDGAAAVIGCPSMAVQVAMIDAFKSWSMDDQPGRDKRYNDDLNSRLKELMV